MLKGRNVGVVGRREEKGQKPDRFSHKEQVTHP